MVLIRQLGRRGMAWVVLAFGSIAVMGAMAASSPTEPGEAGQGKSPSASSSPVSIAAQAANLQASDLTLEDSIASFNNIAALAASPQASDLVVHEWGTFLGMNASDGTALEGMYHEEHALPSFVHSRARDQLRLPMMFLKGETPVIYFYTPRALNVRVGVGFPQGIWTQWYPQAVAVRPSLLEQAQTPDRLKDGRICWFANLIPSSEVPMSISKQRGALPVPTAFALPETRSDALWNFARDVDAAFVKIVDGTGETARTEYERFLFYRGLGQARMPMRADARRGGTLTLESEPSLGGGVRHIFVLKVENGRGAFVNRPALRPGEQADGVIPSMERARPLAEFTEVLADALAAKLTESGLYPKEARAMVNTWKSSYFQNEGVRVLFVLPQSWTDAFIPISIVPKPREIVRVMVGRLELLSPEREQRAETAIRDLAGSDPARRREAFAYLRDQGRYVEPIVRRIAKTTQDEGVRSVCRRLLLTELVTDLRAAVHNVTDGKKMNTDPMQIRVQLARLLREIGMSDEARAEGTALWREIRNRPAPSKTSQAEDPGTLEIRAALYEAMGDDRRAAEDYARRLEGQIRLLAGNANPDALAWIRDWWVGRAYAQCLMRTGQANRTIASLQDKVDRYDVGCSQPTDDRVRRMLLVLLLDAQGHHDRAETEWSALRAQSQLNAASVPKTSLPKL
jgi:hypothetical protein